MNYQNRNEIEEKYKWDLTKRYEKNTTIITSNINFNKWGEPIQKK